MTAKEPIPKWMTPKRLVPQALSGAFLTAFLPEPWNLLALPFTFYLGWLPIIWALFWHPRSPFYGG